VVDDSPIIRTLVRSAIEKKTNWQVCGEAVNGRDAIDKVRDLDPHLVILDLQMPEMNGLDAAQQIALIAPHIPLLMFTMHKTDELIRIAHAVGIRHVFSKSDGLPDTLISAMKNILESESLAKSAHLGNEKPAA
jgi:DNA-binding NarL/FixJ family response regulator